jgi:hypothetical protein
MTERPSSADPGFVALTRAFVEGYIGSRDAPDFDARVDSEINKRVAEMQARIDALETEESVQRHNAEAYRDDYEKQALAAHEDVPAGWKLVPIEMTKEMFNVRAGHSRKSWWEAVLAAAPEPPKEELSK